MKAEWLKILFVVVFVPSLVIYASAQTDPIRDALSQSRELASAKNYQQALQILEEALRLNSNDFDLLLMHARINAWKGNYSAALAGLDFLKQTYVDNTEILDLESDISYWTGDFKSLLTISNKILELHRGNQKSLLRKVISQYELKHNDEAWQSVQQFLQLDPSNSIAINLERLIRERLLKNEMGVSYRYSTFSEVFTDWHNASIHYTRNTSVGPLIFRSSLARQFDITGFQQELDFYPRLNKQSYAYFNVGFSNADIFPSRRIGAEYFRALKAGFEASLGFRYMYYQVNDDELLILTTQLSKYFGNNMLSYRPVLSTLQQTTTLTSIVNYRYYFNSRDHFLSISTAYGRAPVEFVSLFEILRLSAFRLTTEYNFIIHKDLFGRVAAEFQHEEYFESIYRQRYSIEAGISKRF